MTIACKLWLLTVVCVAFLYQDGPQGNGVLCVKKAAHSDEDHSSGAGSSDEDNADHDSENQSGGDSDDGGVGNKNEDSTDEDDDDGDHEDHSKHETNKQSGKGKNQHRHHDDDDDDDDDGKVNDDGEDGEDGEDEDDDKEHHKNIKNKKNNDDEIGEVQVFTTTTITGKPMDILKFLDAGVKPYKPAALDLKKKSNAKLLKKIESVTKSYKSSKGKKNPNEDLTNYIGNIIKESSKKKNSKQADRDKILITLVKNVLLKLLKDM